MMAVTQSFPVSRWVALLAVVLCSLALGGSAVADEQALQSRLQQLNTVTGEEALKGEIKALVADAKPTKDLLALAVKQVKEKKKGTLNYNAASILARVAFELKDYEAAKVFYRLCIDQAVKLVSGKKIADSYWGMIGTLSAAKQHDEAIKLCREFLELPTDDKVLEPVGRLQGAVLRRLIGLYARADRLNEASDLVNRLVEAQPESMLYLDLRGLVQREAGKPLEAIKTYQDAIEVVKKQERLSEDEKTNLMDYFRYEMSGAYIDAKDVNKAAEILKDLLSRKPDSPTFNNDLGYIWADHNMNLEESERLIRKALEEDRKQRQADPELTADQDKDNAAYLDSLGWVLFRQKKYQEAKKYLLQAVQLPDGEHIEILDHLGDVHMALGEKDEAIAIWKKALQVEPLSRREREKRQEVEQKLKSVR